jgi:uncharacterized membrane protein (UPF0127 family)
MRVHVLVPLIGSFFWFTITLMGCSSGVKSQNSGGQMLPITAQATIKETVIDLEVARTPEQQALGLMFRLSLADNRGMLFPFDEPRYAQFWMKNVVIPLDMIFLKQGVVQKVHHNVPGCSQDPCPTYGSGDRLVDAVIELRGGRAAELAIEEGEKIRLKILK